MIIYHNKYTCADKRLHISGDVVISTTRTLVVRIYHKYTCGGKDDAILRFCEKDYVM